MSYSPTAWSLMLLPVDYQVLVLGLLGLCFWATVAVCQWLIYRQSSDPWAETHVPQRSVLIAIGVWAFLYFCATCWPVALALLLQVPGLGVIIWLDDRYWRPSR